MVLKLEGFAGFYWLFKRYDDAPLKSSDFNPPPPCLPLCWDRTSLIATTPSPSNGKDFLLLKAQFAKKYTQW